MEFDAVYLVGLVDSIMPGINRRMFHLSPSVINACHNIIDGEMGQRTITSLVKGSFVRPQPGKASASRSP